NEADSRLKGAAEKYLSSPPAAHPAGCAVPFADSPFDTADIGKRVYLDLIHTATRYVHIMTPYLVIDSELLEGLKFAARRGVDVALMLPGKSDNRLLQTGAVSYYRELLEAGVRLLIFEPGMLHAKTCVADDRRAVVGTINMDYRSLYLNLENAVYFTDCPAVAEVERDFETSLADCHPLTEAEVQRIPLMRRLGSRVLRLLGPML
ncbi:MAG: cardiolipin synthase, partial [Clostridia bacterium]|nr:cardiolipin synthase [Clostridia bacterium]